jgi:ATP-binding cassette, subfamily B, multidrug efflux pump
MDKGNTKKEEKRARMRGPGSMMGGGAADKPQDFKRSMSALIKYVKPYWTAMIVVAIFAIAGTAFSIVSPKMLGNVTTQVMGDYIKIKSYEEIYKQLPEGTVLPEGTTGEFFLQTIPEAQSNELPDNIKDALKDLDLTQRPTIDFSAIEKTILLLLGFYILSLTFNYIQSWIITEVTQKITYQLRKEISQKIHKLPLRYYDTKSFGDVMSRITNDVDTISQTLNQSLSQIISAIATVIGILIMMFSISWQMTTVALLVLPISMVVTILVVKKSQKFFKQQQEVLGSINGHIEETYSGHAIVKVFNQEENAIAKFQEENDKLYESGWKSQFLSGLMHPIINLAGNIGYVGIAVLGGWLAIKNLVTIGDIQAFLQYMRQFNQPIMQTATVAGVLQSTAAASERVFEFLEETEEVEDRENAQALEKIKGDVRFENVIFGYDEDTDVINDFSASIKAGQRVAIVGPTGAGKTTIVNLLMRFYDIKSGAIKIDGVEVKDIKRSSLRNLFGMVLQDTWLFNGTIRENLKYGREDITDERMIEAANSAHVDHVIKSLPEGYDMVIDEDADNLSQGEKQLLTIARAMLADSPILILDEATSSVDTRTELLIQKAMDKLMDGRTSFVIAHRLSTIKGADLILVMNDGNIVEKGSHDKLLEQKGFYADLYNSQFGK